MSLPVALWVARPPLPGARDRVLQVELRLPAEFLRGLPVTGEELREIPRQRGWLTTVMLRPMTWAAHWITARTDKRDKRSKGPRLECGPP